MHNLAWTLRSHCFLKHQQSLRDKLSWFSFLSGFWIQYSGKTAVHLQWWNRKHQAASFAQPLNFTSSRRPALALSLPTVSLETIIFNPPPSTCARTDRTVRRTILPASKNTTAFVSVRARRNSTTTDHWDIQSRSSGSSGSNCSQAYVGFSDRTRTICWIIYLLSWSCKMSRPDRKEYGQVDEPKSPNIGKQKLSSTDHCISVGVSSARVLYSDIWISQ